MTIDGVCAENACAILAACSMSKAGRSRQCTVTPYDGAAPARATASCPVRPVTKMDPAILRRVPLAALGEPRQLSVLVRQDRFSGRKRPRNTQRRIVPDHPPLRLPIPWRRHLVYDLGIRLEGAVAMQQPSRNPQLLPVLR